MSKDYENLGEALICLAENTDLGVFRIENGKFTYVNSSFSKLFGYRVDELLKKVDFFSLIHPDFRKSILESIKHHFEKFQSCTIKAIKKNGEIFSVRIFTKKIRKDGGYAVTGYLVENHDEERFREIESLLKVFLNSVGDYVFLVNEKREVIFSNNPESLTDFNPEKLIGKKIEDVLPEDLARKYLEAFKENEKGRVAEYELDFSFSTGVRSFHIKQAPVTIENRFKGVVLVVREITDLKKAYLELERSESRFRSLFHNVPVGLYTTTPDGRIVNFNPRSSEILGYSVDELKRKNVRDLYVDPEEREVWLREILTRKYVERELRLKRKDGSVVWIRDTARLREEKDGRIFIEGSIQDITELKNLETSLRESLKRMEKLFDSTVMALSTTVEVRDPYTAGHQRRVTKLAMEIAMRMRLEDRVRAIKIAGLLHDIGKIAIPSDILTKPTSLTDIEYMLVKEHPVVGYEILKKVDFPWPIARIVLQHHERINGSGYPDGLKGDEIMIEARILAVADVVEAISSHRPYRAALGIDRALEEIESQKGILYDPDVVDACLDIFENGFSFENDLTNQ